MTQRQTATSLGLIGAARLSHGVTLRNTTRGSASARSSGLAVFLPRRGVHLGTEARRRSPVRGSPEAPLRGAGVRTPERPLTPAKKATGLSLSPSRSVFGLR